MARAAGGPVKTETASRRDQPHAAAARPLRIGAGINTGSATAGGTDYTAIGDTVSAAFPLEAATKALGVGVVPGRGYIRRLGLPGPFRFCVMRSS